MDGTHSRRFLPPWYVWSALFGFLVFSLRAAYGYPPSDAVIPGLVFVASVFVWRY